MDKDRYTWDEGDIEVLEHGPGADGELAQDAGFVEAEHPRGQPGNAGQFGPGGGGKKSPRQSRVEYEGSTEGKADLLQAQLLKEFPLYDLDFGVKKDGSELQLNSIAFDPEHRGKGYGKRVLDRLKGFASEEGIGRIVLMSAPKAKHFYEANGFARTGKTDEYEWLAKAGPQEAAVKAAADSCVEHGRKTNRERGVLLMESGSPETVDGDGSSVQFTPEQMDKMKGGTLVHNHPAGGSLSFADVNIMYSWQMAAMVAVSHDGTRYTARPVSSVAERYLSIKGLAGANAINTAYDSASEGVSTTFWPMINKNALDKMSAGLLHYHAVLTALDDAGLLKYTMDTEPGSALSKAMSGRDAAFDEARKKALERIKVAELWGTR